MRPSAAACRRTSSVRRKGPAQLHRQGRLTAGYGRVPEVHAVLRSYHPPLTPPIPPSPPKACPRRPTLLEPIGELKVFIPDANMGAISSATSTKRRGRVMGMNPDPDNRGWQIVEAEVPMGEMSSYAIDLRSMSQGRGSYSLKFRPLRGSPADQSGRRSSRTPRRQTRNNPESQWPVRILAPAIYYRFFSHCCSMARKPHCSSGRSSLCLVIGVPGMRELRDNGLRILRKPPRAPHGDKLVPF